MLRRFCTCKPIAWLLEAHVCAPFWSPRLLKSQTCGCCLERRVFHAQTSITQHETEQVSAVVQGWLLIEVIASRFLCRMKAAFFPDSLLLEVLVFCMF